jgi:hypothetical protein
MEFPRAQLQKDIMMADHVRFFSKGFSFLLYLFYTLPLQLEIFFTYFLSLILKEKMGKQKFTENVIIYATA